MACWETFITLGTLQMWNNHPHGIMDGISIHVLNRFTIMESVDRIRDFFYISSHVTSYHAELQSRDMSHAELDKIRAMLKITVT